MLHSASPWNAADADPTRSISLTPLVNREPQGLEAEAPRRADRNVPGTAASLVKSLHSQSAALPRTSERLPPPTDSLQEEFRFPGRSLEAVRRSRPLHPATRVRGARAPALPEAAGRREGGTAPASPAFASSHLSSSGWERRPSRAKVYFPSYWVAH